jgi:glutamyl-tRNA reductase
VPQVEQIIAGETACYLNWLHERQVVPALVELRRRAADVMAVEVERTLRRLEHRSSHAAVEQEVELLAHRLVAKLLHAPTVQTKAQAANGNGAVYAQLLAELFALPDPTANADAAPDTSSDGHTESGCHAESGCHEHTFNDTASAGYTTQPAAYRNGYSSHD